MEHYPIDQIEIGTRIRPVNPRLVTMLAHSIKSDGLIQPVLLRRLGPSRARLVAGLHRLEACRSLEKVTIAATWLELTGDAELDDIIEGRAECDENLYRQELDLPSFALFITRKTLLAARRAVVLAHREALEREAAARVKKRAAKSPSEHVSARRAEKAANSAKARAEKAAAKFGVSTGSGLPTAETVDTIARLPSGVLDEVADDAGASRATIRHAVTLVRTLGEDILLLASRVGLGSSKQGAKAELEALTKLKKEFPKSFAGVVKSWQRAVTEDLQWAQGPSRVYREEVKRKKLDAEPTFLAEVTTAIEQVAQLAHDINKARHQLDKFGHLPKTRSARTCLANARTMIEPVRTYLKELREHALTVETEKTTDAKDHRAFAHSQ